MWIKRTGTIGQIGGGGLELIEYDQTPLSDVLQLINAKIPIGIIDGGDSSKYLTPVKTHSWVNTNDQDELIVEFVCIDWATGPGEVISMPIIVHYTVRDTGWVKSFSNISIYNSGP